MLVDYSQFGFIRFTISFNWTIYPFLPLIPFPSITGWCYISCSSYSLSDNINIIFIFLSLILFPSINGISKFETKRINYRLILVIIYLLRLLCYGLLGIIISFILYECLTLILFPSLFIFIPSYYRIKTTFSYFILTILGTIISILMLLILVELSWGWVLIWNNFSFIKFSFRKIT